MQTRDLISGLFFLALGIVFTVMAFRYGLMAEEGVPGPGLFPFVVGFTLIFLSALLFIGRHSSKGEEGGVVQKEAAFFKKGSWVKLLLVLVALCGYVMVLKSLGFVPTTFLFMIFLLRCVEPQKWKITVTVSLLTAGCSYALFDLWLKVDMPKGILKIVGG